jgi:cell division septum initiation protein DivIVA
MPPKIPIAPGTKLPLPPRQPDLEIVDVGARIQIESLNDQVDSLKEDNNSLKNQVDHIRNHLNTFEFATLEHLAGRPPAPSTTPPSKIKKWTVIGTIAASIIAASGAITAAVINNKTARASRLQQAEVARQVVMDNQKSTSESFMAGVREGARQAVIDMEKNKEPPPIKKPDVITKKKKAPQPKP